MLTQEWPVLLFTVVEKGDMLEEEDPEGNGTGGGRLEPAETVWKWVT